jgi:hypothetical protein
MAARSLELVYSYSGSGPRGESNSYKLEMNFRSTR